MRMTKGEVYHPQEAAQNKKGYTKRPSPRTVPAKLSSYSTANRGKPLYAAATSGSVFTLNHSLATTSSAGRAGPTSARTRAW